MPRARFMKIMLFDLLSTCVSASLCCLTIYCAVEARRHNTPSDASESVRNGFSSDACAVSAIWLIFMIWGANTIRAWRPLELQDPMVAFSILSCITITRAGTFVTVIEGLQFVSSLLKGFMLGFAIATGVSLFILPVTSRGNAFHDIKNCVTQIDAVLQSQIAFVGSVFAPPAGVHGPFNETSSHDGDCCPVPDIESRRKQLSDSVAKLNALHGKLQSDLFYAKDEFAWGKLSASDLARIGDLLRSILLPLAGMAQLPEILDMTTNDQGTQETSREITVELGSETQKHSEVVRVNETLLRRLSDAAQLAHLGLKHVLLVLELARPQHVQRLRDKSKDEESNGDELDLNANFTSRFEQRRSNYCEQRKDVSRALVNPEAFSGSEKVDGNLSSNDKDVLSDCDVRQEFYVILYMGHLQDSLLQATLELIKFADSKAADGTLGRSRMIFPRQKSILAWLSLNHGKDGSRSVTETRRRPQVNAFPAHSQSETEQFPDPEHLPPANLWERSSAIFRPVSQVIRSEQSVFGFRVAAASFSVGVLAFLHQTQDFFIHQRCIWAMIVIVIGMNPTSGQSMFGFVTRVVATVVSMLLSLIVWYIVDQKTAGVIVFLYLANVFEYHFYVNAPQYFGASVISIVTFNVIVGYELQVRKLGIERATSNGQPYYPICLFGPYKLAAVAAGCAISFFWVVFPYPITAKSTLRKSVGRSLFVLAEFYSCMHTTVELWLNGELGNIQGSGSTSNKLETHRRRIFKKETVLLNQVRMHSHFSAFEPPIGGKFPRVIYDNIISDIQRMLTNMALMTHTTQNLNTSAAQSGCSNNPDGRWVLHLASIALQSADFNSHSVTSLLCHMSASLTNAQPLPPYLSTGDPFPLVRHLQRADSKLLSLQHIEDPAFSEFVALEVLRTLLGFTIKSLLGKSSES
ncbi:hypothetical protein BDV25DRAFT_21682 [Aspergillus avenaceus]|uniref:Uncharacterized protein n=1 Tax=Aspergillus avenaceus TaxID=36643 RepID=A0A5N6U613_ASPAV|nr:hypothetical protein BDV25DRAFT_21682 [Aspergillus avenaceus]